MAAIVAMLFFFLAYFLHGFHAGNAWFGWQALVIAGLFFAALHLIWGYVPRRRPPP